MLWIGFKQYKEMFSFFTKICVVFSVSSESKNTYFNTLLDWIFIFLPVDVNLFLTVIIKKQIFQKYNLVCTENEHHILRLDSLTYDQCIYQESITINIYQNGSYHFTKMW